MIPPTNGSIVKQSSSRANVAADKSRNSHAYENMVEHLFLADLLRHMWYQRGQVVEVAKAQVDSWGYDVVLAIGETTRYVQLKTSLPADVNERLADRPGGCIVAALPSPDARTLEYRLWEAKAINGLPSARSTVYKRGREERAERLAHRNVRQSLFTKRMDIAALRNILFPATGARKHARAK
jgi:hypothetical protein